MKPGHIWARLKQRKHESLLHSSHSVIAKYEAKRQKALMKHKHAKAASIGLTIENLKRMKNTLETQRKDRTKPSE